MARSGLTLRLLLFLVIALLPALGGLLYVQQALRQEFSGRAVEGVLHHAQLISASAATLVDAARQLSRVVARLERDPAFAAHCGAELEGLRSSLNGYAMLEIVDRAGAPLCRAGIDGGGVVQAQAATAMIAGGFSVGRFSRAADGNAILPMVQPFGAGPQLGAVVVGIDLNWWGQRFRRFATSPGGQIELTDRYGTPLLHVPDEPRAFRLSAATRFATATAPGTLVADGRAIGYVPASNGSGIFVSYSVSLPALFARIDRQTAGGARVAVACAVVSLLLLFLVTRRLVYAPTQALLAAAQRWARGDLAARATVPAASDSEFGRLAIAFNTMAEALAGRQRQMESLNSSLEARVGERTHDLSETNNRLLVEIAERERTDAALRHAHKLQAVGQLAGGIAHEFNNLLTTVLGALELMRLRLSADHPLQRPVAAAAEAAQRGGRLTRQLLTFAKRRRLTPTAIDLNGAIVEMRELLEGSLGRSIPLELDLSHDLWPAMVDRNEIEAAVLNLVLNAREAMGEGGLLRVVTRNVVLPCLGGHAALAGDFVELAVEDDGAGMTADELARAVEPFYTTKPHGQGAGLGLSQAHGIVQQLGGDLHIASVSGHGTTVSLFLPRAVASTAPLPNPAPPPEQQLKVLLVDDDDQVRHVAGDMLVELGYQVTAVARGAAALELLRQQDGQFAAMVVDYAMPGLSGLEVIAQARTLCPAMVTLLITGYMEIDERTDSSLLEPRHVLRKPFTLRELAGRIAELAGDQVVHAG